MSRCLGLLTRALCVKRTHEHTFSLRGGGFRKITMAYPGAVTETPPALQFAEEAGERMEQAFALCEFASQLVGKASEE